MTSRWHHGGITHHPGQVRELLEEEIDANFQQVCDA
jgi:hypothetical protein